MLEVRGSSLYVRIRRQILTYKDGPRAIQSVLHGWFTMVCWKCEDRLYTSESDVYRRQILTYKEGLRAIQSVLHGWFTMVCWKAGADPEGLPWYAGRQGRIQRVYHGVLEGKGGTRGFIMV